MLLVKMKSVSVHAVLMITEPSGCEAGLDKHLQEKAEHTQTYVSTFPANVCPNLPTGGRTRTKSERLLKSLIQKSFINLIRCYRLIWSPLLGNCCRFTPSCSEYALEALRTHSMSKSGMLIIWRLLRCHPWHAGGYDPVPPIYSSIRS